MESRNVELLTTSHQKTRLFSKKLSGGDRQGKEAMEEDKLTPDEREFRPEPEEEEKGSAREMQDPPRKSSGGREPEEERVPSSQEAVLTAIKPKSLVDAIRMQSKAPPNMDGFLPIAMPRPDPPEEVDAELEYASIFVGPRHIDVPHQMSDGDDHMTHVSDLTHITDLTHGPNTPGSPASYGNLMRDFKHQKKIASLKRAANPPGRLDAVDENKNPFSEFYENEAEESDLCMEIDVNDGHIEGATGELNPPASIKLENRHGLPYEESDFRADEEGSHDTWGEAIVGTHIREARERNHSNKQDPGEGGESSRQVQGPPTPRIRANENISHLIRKTLSDDGEVIIDISNIEDIIDVTEDYDISETLPEKQGDNLPSKVDTSERNTQEQQGKSETRDVSSTQMSNADIREDQREKDVTKEKNPNDFVSYSLGCLQSFADGINSQLKNLPELLSEKDVDGMLGILGKELKETSKTVPEEKDQIVMFLGKQIEKAGCGIDRTAGDNGLEVTLNMEDLVKTVKSFPMEDLVENVKKTCQENLAECGVNNMAIQQKKRPDTQTFMVPVNIQTQFDIEKESQKEQ